IRMCAPLTPQASPGLWQWPAWCVPSQHSLTDCHAVLLGDGSLQSIGRIKGLQMRQHLEFDTPRLVTFLADLEEFIHDHSSHGHLAADATEPLGRATCSPHVPVWGGVWAVGDA